MSPRAIPNARLALSRNCPLAAYLTVSTEIYSAAAVQGEELMRERFPDGLVRGLEAKFEAGRAQDYEDAVAEGFAKLVTKELALANPRGYVTTVATNAIRRTLFRAAREQLPDSESPEDGALDSWADPTAEEAIGKAMFDFVRDIIERWESHNVRTATLLILEAAKLGEPLSSAELAEQLEDHLGHDVLPSTARQWRKRGLDRLRAELYDAELSTRKESR
jgi:DNA-directed RNA polymerase specialized sigma24 family protein